MMRSLKILWVLLATIGLTGFMGSNSVLMASHVTHFASDKGPQLPQNESGCVTCHAPGHLQCGQDAPLFGDEENPLPLADTDVCDNCHSPGGVFPGGVDPLYDPNIGAKANWAEGVYGADGTTLKPGKGKWCATCHDDEPANSKANGTGIDAPNVIGDSSQVVYGYYVENSGHGRPGADVKCEDCHNLTGSHIDHDQRTYSASTDNYTEGYRLDAGFPMDIPRYRTWGQTAFSLCYKGCHHLYSDQFSTSTNFRDDRYGEPRHYHDVHLDETFSGSEGQVWDSDWGGENCGIGQGGLCADSAMSCPACHNVHGSPMAANGSLEPNPVMIRHGELISMPGTTDKVPAFDFHWYWDNDGSQETADFGQSLWGGMLCGYTKYLDYNHVCYGCHDTGELKYKREPPGGGYIQVLVDDFEEYADDGSLQVNWKHKQDAKKPRLELSGGPDGSKCMRVRVNWTKDPDHDYGTVLRKYDSAIDLTKMVRFNFYVKVNNTSRIEKVKVRLSKSEDSAYCNSTLSTSELDDGVWQLVSLPRESFTCTDFGLVKEIQLRIFEYDPGQSYAQDVYFDDIRLVKPEGQS